ILKDIKPDVVFSKGGFASCPVVWAAKQLKIPVVLHESDITPGLANKLCLPFASKICYAFPETAEHLPKDKAIYTGIPIRKSFFEASREKGLSYLGFDGKKPVLTLIGGSQGSQFLNETLVRNLDTLTKTFDICHICGKGNLNHELLNVHGYAQFEYVNHELPDICHATDLFISRAGATTIYEILALHKPAVLVPLSRGSRGDQILNAESFKKQGFAEKLDEDKITDELFLKTVSETFAKKDFYAENAKKANLSDCGNKIVQIILKTTEK
ncbi:MAG: glycosyltransferase, partial [Clostridia bacterium]|nr:glycosyltransferase [Clostridia bacterium]